jgi:hypothetical protein
MKVSPDSVSTPIYLKTGEDFAWPEHEPMFYLLAKDGIYLCRNSRFSKSCVKTDRFPSGLASQETFLQSNYPKIPQILLERVVGFFDVIAQRHDSECGALFVYDINREVMDVVIPKQTGGPAHLDYEVPTLAPGVLLIGDIHSHVNVGAFSSGVDQDDEVYRPGIHLIVGVIRREPPEFHCEIVSDGARFKVNDLGIISEGYEKRRTGEVPQQWLDQFTLKQYNNHNYQQNTNQGRELGEWVFDPKKGVHIWKPQKDKKQKRSLFRRYEETTNERTESKNGQQQNHNTTDGTKCSV